MSRCSAAEWLAVCLCLPAAFLTVPSSAFSQSVIGYWEYPSAPIRPTSFTQCVELREWYRPLLDRMYEASRECSSRTTKIVYYDDPCYGRTWTMRGCVSIQVEWCHLRQAETAAFRECSEAVRQYNAAEKERQRAAAQARRENREPAGPNGEEVINDVAEVATDLNNRRATTSLGHGISQQMTEQSIEATRQAGVDALGRLDDVISQGVPAIQHAVPAARHGTPARINPGASNTSPGGPESDRNHQTSVDVTALGELAGQFNNRMAEVMREAETARLERSGQQEAGSVLQTYSTSGRPNLSSFELHREVIDHWIVGRDQSGRPIYITYETSGSALMQKGDETYFGSWTFEDDQICADWELLEGACFQISRDSDGDYYVEGDLYPGGVPITILE